jgi:pimeloyl-ACP methyl ester carboxylesterase
MSTVFLIPGLGADYRLFKNIVIEGHDTMPVKWIEPARDDTLTTYAQKLVKQYNIIDGSIVIGVSLGGMLTTEIANLVKLRKAILISSIKSVNEAPWYFPVLKRVPVYKLIPEKLIGNLGYWFKPFFGLRFKDDAELFRAMINDNSPKFIKWAMHALLQWNSKTVPANIYHITGDNDHIFSSKRISGATIIKGGTHLMVFNRAKEINLLLKDTLNETA